MTESQLLFNERLHRLGMAHRALEGGYATRMRRDGLVVRIPKGRRLSLPWRQALSVVLVFVMVKLFLFVNLGEVAYSERLSMLRQGDVIDRAGAVVMQVDPLTRAAARGISAAGG